VAPLRPSVRASALGVIPKISFQLTDQITEDQAGLIHSPTLTYDSLLTRLGNNVNYHFNHQAPVNNSVKTLSVTFLKNISEFFLRSFQFFPLIAISERNT
jgi:hypothetical protein